jgi:hypothetical protein
MTETNNPVRGLHRRAEHPGSEFGAAKVKTLALGWLTGGGLEHQVENPLAALLHRLFAVEDRRRRTKYCALVHRTGSSAVIWGRKLIAAAILNPGLIGIGPNTDRPCDRL